MRLRAAVLAGLRALAPYVGAPQMNMSRGLGKLLLLLADAPSTDASIAALAKQTLTELLSRAPPPRRRRAAAAAASGAKRAAPPSTRDDPAKARRRDAPAAAAPPPKPPPPPPKPPAAPAGIEQGGARGAGEGGAAPELQERALSREEFKVAARSVTEAAFAQFGDGPPPAAAEVSAAIESLVRDSVGSHV